MIIRPHYTLPTFAKVTPASALPLSATCEPTSNSTSHVSVPPHQSSPLTSERSGSPDAQTANEPLRAQAERQPPDTKPQPIWIIPDSPPRPPRPPRKPRRPQTAPHSSVLPSFDFGSLPKISQYPEPSTDSSESNACIDDMLSPSFTPDTLLSCSPIRHTGFLNRIPRPIQVDEDSVSILSSISQRRHSVPTLRSYASRPSTAPSRDEPDQLSGNAVLRPRLSLLSMTAHKPTSEVRNRAKSSIAFSDASFARQKGRSLDLTVEEKLMAVTPPSSTETRPVSEISSSPPVTATTLNDESMSSFTVYESPQEQEVQVRPAEELAAEKKWFWETKDKLKRKPHVDGDEETLVEPKPGQLVTLMNTRSTPALVVLHNPSKLDVKSHKETTREHDDKPPTRVTGSKPIPRKAGGTMRRVWKSLVGRA